jgi:hypothetical protein
MRQPIPHTLLYQQRVVGDYRLHVALDPALAKEIGTPRRQRQETGGKNIQHLSQVQANEDFPAERSGGNIAQQ